MPVEVEAAGQIDEFLRVLKRRVWWIVIPFVIIGSLGIFYAVVVPKKYVVYSEIMVRDRSGPGDEAGQPASDMEGQVATYSIRAPERIRSVLIDRKWPPGFKDMSRAEQQEFIDELLQDLSVRLPGMPPDSGQQLVQISYKYTDATDAYNFVSHLIKNWTDEVVEGALQTTERQLNETISQISELDAQLELNAAERAEIRAKHQIAAVSAGPNSRGERPEHEVFANLRQVNAEIDEWNEEIAQLQEEADLLQGDRDRMDQWVPREAEVIGETDDADLRRIDREIEELERVIVNRNHSTTNPDRIRLEGEIRNLQRERQKLITRASRAMNDPAGTVENEERLQKTEELRKLRDRIARLANRLERAEDRRRGYALKRDAVNEALARLDILVNNNISLVNAHRGRVAKRTELEFRFAFLDSDEGVPWEWRRAPTIPLEPTSPNPWFISIGSLLMGLGIGLGLALLKEYSKSCFRSPRELSRVMTHPVLGKINSIRTRRERARTVLVRAVLGGGTLLFAVGVGWITWAWAADSPALTDSLRTAIDDFRELLM